MKHLLKTYLVSFGMMLALFIPMYALHAAGDYGLKSTIDTINKDSNDVQVLPEKFLGAESLPEAIGLIVSIALGFLGIIFFGIILFGGFTWMTAMGNSEKTDSAKGMIEGAVIGLIIVLLAYALTRFILVYIETGALPG